MKKNLSIFQKIRKQHFLKDTSLSIKLGIQSVFCSFLAFCLAPPFLPVTLLAKLLQRAAQLNLNQWGFQSAESCRMYSDTEAVFLDFASFHFLAQCWSFNVAYESALFILRTICFVQSALGSYPLWHWSRHATWKQRINNACCWEIGYG